MHFSKSTFAVALLTSVVTADYYVDPDSVLATDRATWCQYELSTCPLICAQIDDGETLVNDCDPDTLQYGCICGNGEAPDVSQYTLTLPYFTCVEWGTQCVEACADNLCADSCRADHPCGAQNPNPENATLPTTTSGSALSTETTESGETVHTGLLGSSEDGTTGAAIHLGHSYGSVIVAGAIFVGFAIL